MLFLGIEPEFYESEYGKFYEDAVFGNPTLDSFQPEIVLVFTSFVNLRQLPQIQDTPKDVDVKPETEYERFANIWEGLAKRYGAIIIQNNIEIPFMSPLGNLNAVIVQGIRRYVEALNERFTLYAETHAGIYLHDLHHLAAQVGLSRFHNRFQYYGFKFAVNYDVVPIVAASIAHLLGAILGKMKKCLILDLDNTLWGGVIGDDGVENIQLGNETPVAEAYTEFQLYVFELKKRGVILAICSKNDEAVAKGNTYRQLSARSL